MSVSGLNGSTFLLDDPVFHKVTVLRIAQLIAVVRYHDERRPIFLAAFRQHLHHAFLIFLVQIARRLIRKNDPWRIDKRPGDRNALLLATGKRFWHLCELALYAQRFHQFSKAFLPAFRPRYMQA